MNRAVTLAAAVAFLAGACSKSDSSNTETSSASPSANVAESASACTIATDAEMAEAIGAPVTGKDEVNSHHCIFKTANAVVYADVDIDRENAAASWEGINAGDSTIGAAQDSLAGIGDKAFFGPRDRLYFMKGNAFVAVEGGFDDQTRARAKKVAQLIATKL